MTVGARLHTTYWGLLKQPDNQKQARGVDVVEGTAVEPTTVTLHDHRISVSQSSNVQIGDSNIQDVERLRVDKLIAATDHSEASITEKAEAKSLLKKLASTVWTVLRAVFFRGK